MAAQPRKITLEWNELHESASDDEVLADVIDIIVQAVGPMSGATVIVNRLSNNRPYVSILHTNDSTLLKIVRELEVTRYQNEWNSELEATYVTMIADVTA